MTFWETLLIAFAVSVDAFALSVSGALAGGDRRKGRDALLAALFFGGFQFFMPVIGFFAAMSLRELVAVYDHWIAFLLLAFVGGRMICEAVRGSGDGGVVSADFFHWRRLFVPAVATSIDALAVGAGLAFSNAPILFPALAMGVVTGAISALGVFLGRKIGGLAGERVMALVGGAAIILIGANILRQHLV